MTTTKPNNYAFEKLTTGTFTWKFLVCLFVLFFQFYFGSVGSYNLIKCQVDWTGTIRTEQNYL